MIFSLGGCCQTVITLSTLLRTVISVQVADLQKQLQAALVAPPPPAPAASSERSIAIKDQSTARATIPAALWNRFIEYVLLQYLESIIVVLMLNDYVIVNCINILVCTLTYVMCLYYKNVLVCLPVLIVAKSTSAVCVMRASACG